MEIILSIVRLNATLTRVFYRTSVNDEAVVVDENDRYVLEMSGATCSRSFRLDFSCRYVDIHLLGDENVKTHRFRIVCICSSESSRWPLVFGEWHTMLSLNARRWLRTVDIVGLSVDEHAVDSCNLLRDQLLHLEMVERVEVYGSHLTQLNTYSGRVDLAVTLSSMLAVPLDYLSINVRSFAGVEAVVENERDSSIRFVYIGTPFTLTIENHAAFIANSEHIRTCLRRTPHLVVEYMNLIKFWCEKKQVTPLDAGGCMSAYAITLLMFFFLQDTFGIDLYRRSQSRETGQALRAIVCEHDHAQMLTCWLAFLRTVLLQALKWGAAEIDLLRGEMRRAHSSADLLRMYDPFDSDNEKNLLEKLTPSVAHMIIGLL